MPSRECAPCGNRPFRCAVCACAGIAPAAVWKEAVSRTSAQLPHLRQREAGRGRRDSSEAQGQYPKASASSEKESAPLHRGESPSRSISPQKEHRRHTQQNRHREGHRQGSREASKADEQRSGQHGKSHDHADASAPSHIETGSPTKSAATAAKPNTRSRSPISKHREESARADGTSQRRTPSKNREKGKRKGSVSPASNDQREEGEQANHPIESTPPEAVPTHGEDKTREEAKAQRTKPKPSRRRRQQPNEQPDDKGTPADAGEFKSVKKISKGILSRAGTLFRKQGTKKTGE